jgi:hypothetical protein
MKNHEKLVGIVDLRNKTWDLMNIMQVYYLLGQDTSSSSSASSSSSSSSSPISRLGDLIHPSHR